MNWMYNLERKYGKYAIKNITRYMALISIIGSIFLSAIGDEYIYKCAFYMPYILKGQVWRLVTWVFYPMSAASILEFLFIFCLVMLGDSLESCFGSFRMNLYFLTGILLNIFGGIIIYIFTGISIELSLYYILFSLYVMLGLFMPDAEVRLYFVLPIKMKWLMGFYAVGLAYEVIRNFSFGMSVGIYKSAELIFALINLGIFVYLCRNQNRYRTVRRHRKTAQQQQFNNQVKRTSDIVVHKCCICGRTQKDDPSLVFRYCSKCDGGREYCQDHLFTHEHYKMM